MNSLTLGILGAGHLASYTIAGLRQSGDQRKILLSPRNANTAKQLANAYGCEVQDSNQQLVDNSDIVLIAVRPPQIATLLNDLSIPSEKIIVSAAAGVSCAELEAYLAISGTVIRMMPTVSAETCSGMVPIYPHHPAVVELANHLGEAFVFDCEEDLNIAISMACMNGWMYAFMGEINNWLITKGQTPEQARAMVLANIEGSVNYARLKNTMSLEAITNSIATEGTYTKLGLEALKNDQVFTLWSSHLENVFTNLQKNNKN